MQSIFDASSEALSGAETDDAARSRFVESELDERIELALARAARFGGRLALLLLGPHHGARQEHDPDVESRIARCIRRVDYLARLDLGRFAVLKTDLQVPEHAATMARRLLVAARGEEAAAALESGVPVDRLEERSTESGPFESADHRLGDPGSGLACGIAIWPPGRADRHNLLHRATLAFEHARERGAGAVYFDDLDVDAEVRRSLELSKALDGSWERRELFLELQPQVDLVDRRIDGVEALMRWNHPTHGRLEPARFLGVAERCGHMRDIGRWVLDEACAAARRWQRGRHLPVPVAVNVSSDQVADRGFTRAVLDALERHGLVPHALELEVTEDVLASCPRRATFLELNDAGVRLTLDDFGTGRSSLEELRTLGFRKLKIHPVLVRRLPNDRDARAIVRAAVAIARHLGLEPVAEGVETAEQASALVEIGCPQALGRHLAPPLALEPLLDLIAHGNGRIDPWTGSRASTSPVAAPQD